MNIDKGLNLIKKYEGLRLTAYKALSTEKYYTIGYGHYGADVTKGMTITQERANELLTQDLAKFIRIVDSYNKKYNWNENQYNAMLSFCYNVGGLAGVTANSTRTINQIAKYILKYNKSGGKTIAGLTRRRNGEYKLYCTPITSTTKTNEQIAKEVIAGKWGTGQIRKLRLEAAGYKYSDIQKIVNKLLQK